MILEDSDFKTRISTPNSRLLLFCTSTIALLTHVVHYTAGGTLLNIDSSTQLPQSISLASTRPFLSAVSGCENFSGRCHVLVRWGAGV